MTRINLFVAALVWVSAFVVVSTQYRVRQLTTEINKQRDLAYQLENERTKATLAQSRLSTPSRVESTAREVIGMELPDPQKSLLLDLRIVAAQTAQTGVKP
ncbi:MAG: cell division protein FtsL [Burkholderiales bacterium]|nr:MAG: cell division protein FtsL [Betaproteobacteria bacterium]TAG83329.1 MAG: cell division protein FtsL [Burkholderiales bacterium]